MQTAEQKKGDYIQNRISIASSSGIGNLTSSERTKSSASNATSGSNRRRETKSCVRIRILVFVLCFISGASSSGHRSVLHMAIISMVNHSTLYESQSDENYFSDCPENKVQDSEKSKNEKHKFRWDNIHQGWLLSAAYYGYFIAQIFAGWVARKFGPKNTNILGLLVSSVISILIPTVSHYGVVYLFILRLFQGLSQGLNYPSIITLYAEWIPISERPLILSFSTVGIHVGTAIAMPVTAFLCEQNFAGGWPSAFYVFGVEGIIVCLLFYICVVPDPKDHPWISENELQYILSQTHEVYEFKKSKIPWKDILASCPVFAVLIAKMSWSWGYITILTWIPYYLYAILQMPIMLIGFLTSGMFLVLSMFMLGSGFLSSLISTKTKFDTSVRKIFEMGALLGPAICLLTIAFLECNYVGRITLLVVSMAFLGMVGGGDVLIVGDMSPEFAGAVFGLINGLSGSITFAAPIASGYLLGNQKFHLYNWNYVLYLSSGIFTFGAIVFLLFATAELQRWGLRRPKT